jgi:hypothetical protein
MNQTIKQVSRLSIMPKPASEVLIEKLAQMIDKKYDEMGDGEIRISQQKLKALRDRVRAYRAARPTAKNIV